MSKKCENTTEHSQNILHGFLFVWWCLTSLSTIFHLYPGGKFYWWKKLVFRRPVVSHWQTLSHNVVHLTLMEIRPHNISGVNPTTMWSQPWWWPLFYMGMLCITKEKKYKKNFAEFPFANVVFHRMVMIFYEICTFSFIYYALGLLQYSKIVWSNCLHIHKLYLNVSKW